MGRAAIHTGGRVGVVFMGALLLASIGCERGPSQPTGMKTPEVMVSKPRQLPITEHEDFTGRTEAVANVTIRARVTGYLDKVNFKEGTEVTKGDVLFEIDPRPYQARLDQAKADLTNKKAVVIKSEALFKRTVTLARTGAATQEDVDNQKGDCEVARAAVGQAEAKLREAQLNLDFTHVIAPISGRISRQLIDPGNLVMADLTPLTTVVSQDPMYAYFDVDERTVLRIQRLIHEGKVKSARDAEVPVFLALADEPTDSYSLQGTINFVDNQIDAKTGTLRLRGVFLNANRFLAPGLFVRVRLPIGTAYPALLVAEQALGTDQGQRFLYTLNDNNEVVYQRVKVGPLENGLRVIAEGLKAGERVIVSGLQRVRPGVRVAPKSVEMPTGSAKTVPAVTNQLATLGSQPAAIK